MSRKVLIAAVACLFAAYALPASAAKVGDRCTAKSSKPGHWVKPYGHITMSCKADPEIRAEQPKSGAGAQQQGAVGAPRVQSPTNATPSAKGLPAALAPSGASKPKSVSTTSVININTMTKPELTAVPGLSPEAMWTMMNFRTPFGYADANAFATRVCSRTDVNFGSTDIQIDTQTLSGFQCAKAALTYQANGTTHAYALPVELTGNSTVPVAPTS